MTITIGAPAPAQHRRYWAPGKQRHARYWTRAQVSYLQDYRGDMTDAQLARKLGRSEMAVIVKGKRLCAYKKSNWLTAAQVAQILGIDQKRAVWLGAHGVLRLTRSAVNVGNGNLAWRCEIEDLERFLRLAGPWYDPRRITGEPWRSLALRAHADPWLTTSQAAAIVGLSHGGFLNYVRRGDVPSVKVPGGGGMHARVRRSALTGFRPLRPELVGHTPRR